MDYLPLFAELKEKPVLVIGGGDIAARKIMFLHRAGANVQVVAAALSEEVAALVERQEIQWRAHEFEEQQLDDVFLAIAATDDDALNQRVSAAANARYRLVNVVDNQPLCSVVFPSIVDRSPLLIAIFSGGSAPVLSRLIREKIEALLPTNLGRVAEAASYWRHHIKTHLTTTAARRHFWERVFNGRFASLMIAGNKAAADKALEEELHQPEKRLGEIILVGAGPGDAGLLTLRGLQAVQKADVVVYLHVEAVLDGFHCQLCAAVAESVGDPVVLILIAVQQDRHAGAALDRHKADDMILDVHRHEDHTVSTGIITELGRILRAVELVQVGKGIGIVDGLGALVRADEQDIQHILVGKGAALGHGHIGLGVGQAGAVQILILLGTDLAHLADAAVIVAQQVKLAVDIQERRHRQQHHDAQRDHGRAATLGQPAPAALLWPGFLGRCIVFRFQFVHFYFPLSSADVTFLCAAPRRGCRSCNTKMPCRKTASAPARAM